MGLIFDDNRADRVSTDLSVCVFIDAIINSSGLYILRDHGLDCRETQRGEDWNATATGPKQWKPYGAPDLKNLYYEAL